MLTCMHLQSSRLLHSSALTRLETSLLSNWPTCTSPSMYVSHLALDLNSFSLTDMQGGECRDIANDTACPPGHADQATITWLNQVIDEVNPDLIVLTGDQCVPSRFEPSRLS